MYLLRFIRVQEIYISCDYGKSAGHEQSWQDNCSTVIHMYETQVLFIGLRLGCTTWLWNSTRHSDLLWQQWKVLENWGRRFHGNVIIYQNRRRQIQKHNNLYIRIDVSIYSVKGTNSMLQGKMFISVKRNWQWGTPRYGIRILRIITGWKHKKVFENVYRNLSGHEPKPERTSLLEYAWNNRIPSAPII